MTATKVEMLNSFLSGSKQSGSGGGDSLFNPSNGEEIARCSTHGLDIASGMEFARTVGGPNLRRLSFAERGDLLQRMAEAMHAHREELLALSTESGGNTRGDAKFDVDGAIGTLSYYARLGGKLGDSKFHAEDKNIKLSRSARYVGRHVSLPLTGVAIHINAYNFPAWGMAEKAACALLAGMPVLSKPASSTAVLAERIVNIWIDADILPEGCFSFVCGGAGDMLDHVTGQDVIAFTGSAATAAKIREHQAIRENSTRVNVEADSLNAAILGAEVEAGSLTWNTFLQEVAKDMTQKAGQKCTAIRRIFVPTSSLDDVLNDLVEELSMTKYGDPAAKGVRMGPVASSSQLADVQEGIASLMSECELVHGEIGAGELVAGIADQGCYQQPVLLQVKDANAASLVHDREVFGPVATIIPFDNEQQLACLVQKGKGSLVTSVYSDSRDFMESMMFAIAPFHGRLNFCSKKVAEHSVGPGTVLPNLIHGGPGRAGGGEELGGEKGLRFYWQRTALQGDEPMLAKMLGPIAD